MTYEEVVEHLNNYIHALKTVAMSKRGDELATLNIMIGFNKYILKNVSWLQAELQANDKFIEQNNLDSSDINNLMKEIISILANDIDKNLDSHISVYRTLDLATFIIALVLLFVFGCVAGILIPTMYPAIVASIGVLLGHILIFALMPLILITIMANVGASEIRLSLLEVPRLNDIVTNAVPKTDDFIIETMPSHVRITHRILITDRIICFFDAEKTKNLRDEVNREFQTTNNQLI